MIQTKNYSLHIAPDGVATWVRLSQNENGRSLIFNVTGDGTINIPSGSTATISGTKPDGVVYSAVGTVSGTQVTITEDVQLTAAAGEWDAKIRITNSGQTVATGRIHFVIDADPVAPGSVPSSSELSGLVAEAEQYAENSHYWADEAAQAAASIDSTWFIDGAKNTDVSTLTTTSKKVAGAINELNSGKLDKTGDAKDATVTFTTGDAADSDVTPTTAWTSVSKLTSGSTFKTILEAVSKMFKNIRKHEKLLGATNISSLSTDGTVTGTLSKLNTDMFPFKGVLTSSNDLNTLTGNDKRGLYYITAAPANSPVGWATLVNNAYGEAVFQLIYNGSFVYIRDHTGNPAAWGEWHRLADQSAVDTLNALTAVSVSFESSLSLGSASKIYAYLFGTKLLFLNGYIQSTVDVPANTTIATLPSAYKPAFQTFDSPNPDRANATGGRFKLTTDGKLMLEAILTTGAWYSFSFTVPIQ